MLDREGAPDGAAKRSTIEPAAWVCNKGRLVPSGILVINAAGSSPGKAACFLCMPHCDLPDLMGIRAKGKAQTLILGREFSDRAAQRRLFHELFE